MTFPSGHSPVGASAIKRVLACPASVGLAQGIEDEESDHAALGTAVHALIEVCFTENCDAWTKIGTDFGPLVVDRKMANAAQAMLDAVRTAHPDRNQGNFWVERKFHCPTIHPLFFGTSDCVYLDEMELTQPNATGDGTTSTMIFRTLHIWDYKNGAGVIIEVEENEQTMYYACGALEDLSLWDRVDEVVLHIVQPNGFHTEGPVREWRTTPEFLATWLEDKLVPGIELAISVEPKLYENNGQQLIQSGEHCRFCPARSHACPQLMADMEELQQMIDMIATLPKGAEELTNDQVGRFLNLVEVAKIVGKAANSTAFRRINAGARIAGWKLAKAKANREWKEGAEAAAEAEFGSHALTKPEMKSPAQIDELPAGNQFTARWAQKPDKGLTLVKDSDSRPEVSTDTKGLFQDVTKQAAPEPPPTIELPPARRRGGQNKTADIAA